MEHEHLEQAHRHVAEAERVVAKQIALVERLKAHGHDVTIAENLLETFKSNLEAHRRHRDFIIEVIAEGGK